MLSLCYHKIDVVQNDWTGITTSPDTFRWQLQYLSENYHINDVHNLPYEPGKQDVLITFDDGYADNYTNALPILEELHIPAIFFVSTGHLDTDTEDWPNELAWLILEGTRYPEVFNADSFSFETRSFDQRLEMHRNIEKVLIHASNTQRNAIMEAIRQWADADNRQKRKSFRMLSKAQLQALSRSPYATIGAHTVNHPSLGALCVEEQQYEILESKRVIERAIGQDVSFFAYPFGGFVDYSKDTIQILKHAGFQKAFSTTYKRKTIEPSPYEIPRVCISESTCQEFIAKLDLYKEKTSYLYECNL